MTKITFMGAGSAVFAKAVVGDCLLTPSLREAHYALYDIDADRLSESKRMLDTLNANDNDGRARISTHLGVEQRRDALRGADYVINAIQVGGYKPCTETDFEIPKRYGLRQTIGDTIGIGGIFRALRTLPVMLDFARDMEAVCPNAWFLNYTNPMSMLTGGMLRGTGIRTVGLCHSVQVGMQHLLDSVGLSDLKPLPKHRIAGINHMGWLLEIEHEGRDLYPEIKQRAAERIAAHRRGECEAGDLVRLETMLQFGYYVTESSVHFAEYLPYWIRAGRPDLLEAYGIPLDEYPRRCVRQIEKWQAMSRDLIDNPDLRHTASNEYAARILNAIETGECCQIGGNVMNTGLIPNLPPNACVEVPCLVDRNGVQGCHVGMLPEPCAALCRTSINVHLLTIEAILEGRRDRVYQAAMLDPHTSCELPIDDIRRMCDDLLEAHGDWIPPLR